MAIASFGHFALSLGKRLFYMVVFCPISHTKSREDYIVKKILVSILCLILLSGCNFSKAENNLDVSESTVQDAHENVFFPVSYKDTIPMVKVKPIEDNAIYIIQEEKKLETGSFFLFKSNQNDSNIYGGFQQNNVIYDLGILTNELNMGADASLIIEPYGKLLRVFSVESARSFNTRYYLVKDEELFLIYTAPAEAIEIDIDHDGIKEIISQRGLPMYVLIGKYIDGQFFSSNINRQHGFRSSTFELKDGAVLFTIYYEENGQEISKEFIYKDGGLVLYRGEERY